MSAAVLALYLLSEYDRHRTVLNEQVSWLVYHRILLPSRRDFTL